jgi:hypothetical protein
MVSPSQAEPTVRVALKHSSRTSIKSAAGLIVVTLVLSAAEVRAQELSPPPPKQRGVFLVPMLTVSETLDDNLLFTQFPESDFITRVSLGVETGYRSTPFTLDVLASRAGDSFARHPEFNTTDARTLGQISLAYLPSRSLIFAATSCYLETRTPSELNILSGLSVGRSLARRVSVAPSVELRLGHFSTAVGLFTLADDTLDGRYAGTRTGGVGFDRRVTGRDTLSLRYEHRWFSFTGGEKPTADVFTVGWIKDLNARTVLLLKAGPRMAKGKVNPEVLASIKRRDKRGRLSVTYSRNQATTLGKNGALDTESLVALYTVRVAKRLEISSGPGAYRNALHGLNLRAYRLNLETLWHFSHFFHLGAAYALDLQQPDFGATGQIRRGSFQMRLLVSPPQRRPEPPTTDVAPADASAEAGSN